MLDFRSDYISQASSLTLPVGTTVSYPSGFGTLGLGGDGKLIAGNGNYILGLATSLSFDLNQSPAFYGLTTNSPVETSALGADWVYDVEYEGEISGAAFGSRGFGVVDVVNMTDSPSKIGQTFFGNIIASPIAQAPEPASLTLLAVGLASLGMVLRTRRA